MDRLLHALGRVRRRLLAVRALEAGLAGAIGGSALAAVATLLRVLQPQAMPVAAAWPHAPLVLVAFGFAAAFVVRLAAGVSPGEAARAADRAAGLKERLATALEVRDRAAAGARPGGLDDRLLTQARAAAEALDPARLALARTAGRRTRILLVAVLVLVAGGFVPSAGGPPVGPEAAGRAAETLKRVADRAALAPAVRQAVEKAVALLQQPGARRQAADQATARVVQAAADARQARRGVSDALAASGDADVREMVRAAGQGSAGGAAAAAEKAARRLGSPPGAGGAPLAERERVADSLDAAFARAAAGGLEDLAGRLRTAADAVRPEAPRPDEVERVMTGLAAALTAALGGTEAASGGVAAIVEAVAEARRALGLPASAAGHTPDGLGAAAGRPAGGAPTVGVGPAEPGAAGGGAEPDGALPREVRPEDRDVVRRYFGG